MKSTNSPILKKTSNPDEVRPRVPADSAAFFLAACLGVTYKRSCMRSLPFVGSRRRLGSGLTRRDLLHAGGLSALGLGLTDVLRLREAGATSKVTSGRFGQAKSCILIFLFGSPAQHETFDPKPRAPVEIQGELREIETVVPGIQIGERLPLVAQVADRLTIVRSLTHALPFHGVHYAISGIPTISATVEADPADRSLWPCLGSVVDYVDQTGAVDYVDQTGAFDQSPAMPRNVALPYVLYSKANFRPLGGPYAGFLGSRYDPVWTEFRAPGTKAVPNPTAKPDVYDPFGGIRERDGFDLGPATLNDDITPRRLGLRQSLLTQLDQSRRWLETCEPVGRFANHQQQAFSLLTGSRLDEALDIHREPKPDRERYGMTLFGQSLLAARRIVEAEGRCVTVFWDAYADATAGWDTHFHHYARLKEFLLPGFDQAYSALIRDLDQRGLLDETLVLCLSEHGRTPRLSNNPGGGREHWSRVYSAVLAGGGTARGKVVGQSDAIGGDVAQTPISPKDILATSLHLLGIDPNTTLLDQLQRPVRVAGDGVVRHELIG